MQNGVLSDHTANPFWSTHVTADVPSILYPGSHTNTTLSPTKLEVPIATECAGCCICVQAFPRQNIKKYETHIIMCQRWV